MGVIAKITSTFKRDGSFWHEARVEGKMRFSFKAPQSAKLEIGDAIEFDALFLDQDAVVPLYSSHRSIVIRVSREDFTDLSDRRILNEVRYEPSGTTIKMIATGQIEVTGPQPGSSGTQSMAGFDCLEDYEWYVSRVRDEWRAAGTKAEREAILKWLDETALPALRKVSPRTLGRDVP